MQLTSPAGPDPTITDVATAVRDAHRVLGQGPAVTVLFPTGRQEQGMASLAQWAAKGAHLLESELLLEPGDLLHLDAPLSWSSAAVCLAAWWAGVAVTLDGDAEVAVIHEERLAQARVHGDVFALGDAIDGSPRATRGPEPWVRAVQAFPDQPPRPRASADAPALLAEGRTWSQGELLEQARHIDPGTVGVDPDAVTPSLGLLAVTTRPLVSGRATVVLRDVDRSAAEGEKVAHWL